MTETNDTAALSSSARDASSASAKLLDAPVGEIVVGRGFRRDLGDIKRLAASLAEVGLLQPVLVDASMRLVCGSRRLAAAQSLGWMTIPALQLDIEDPLLATAAEDANRKSLRASEKYAIAQALRVRAEDEGWRRKAIGGRMQAAAEKGRLDAALAAHVGLSRESLRKIRQIHERAAADPEGYGDLALALDADGKVDRHFREFRLRSAREGQETVRALFVEPKSIYRTIGLSDNEVAKLVSETNFVGQAEPGAILVIPTDVELLSHAALVMAKAGFKWRHTFEGGKRQGERLWLVGALGKREPLGNVAFELLAEGCKAGLSAAVESAEVALEGASIVLALHMAEE